MPAALPGTIILTAATGSGLFTLTIRFDPDTGAFEESAMTTGGGAALGHLRVHHVDGTVRELDVPSGMTVRDVHLADLGVVSWAEVASLSLTAT